MISHKCKDNGERFNKFLRKLASLPKSRGIYSKKLYYDEIRGRIWFYCEGRRKALYLNLSDSPLSFVDTIKVCFLLGDFDEFLVNYNFRVGGSKFSGKYKKKDLYRLHDDVKEETVDIIRTVFEARTWRNYLDRQRAKISLLKYEIQDIRRDMFYFLHAFSRSDFERIAAQVMGTRKRLKEDEESVVRAMEIIRKIECFDGELDNICDVLKAKEEEIFNKCGLSSYSRVLDYPYSSALTYMIKPNNYTDNDTNTAK